MAQNHSIANAEPTEAPTQRDIPESPNQRDEATYGQQPFAGMVDWDDIQSLWDMVIGSQSLEIEVNAQASNGLPLPSGSQASNQEVDRPTLPSTSPNQYSTLASMRSHRIAKASRPSFGEKGYQDPEPPVPALSKPNRVHRVSKDRPRKRQKPDTRSVAEDNESEITYDTSVPMSQYEAALRVSMAKTKDSLGLMQGLLCRQSWLGRRWRKAFLDGYTTNPKEWLRKLRVRAAKGPSRNLLAALYALRGRLRAATLDVDHGDSTIQTRVSPILSKVHLYSRLLREDLWADKTRRWESPRLKTLRQTIVPFYLVAIEQAYELARSAIRHRGPTTLRADGSSAVALQTLADMSTWLNDLLNALGIEDDAWTSLDKPPAHIAPMVENVRLFTKHLGHMQALVSSVHKVIEDEANEPARMQEALTKDEGRRLANESERKSRSNETEKRMQQFRDSIRDSTQQIRLPVRQHRHAARRKPETEDDCSDAEDMAQKLNGKAEADKRVLQIRAAQTQEREARDALQTRLFYQSVIPDVAVPVIRRLPTPELAEWTVDEDNRLLGWIRRVLRLDVEELTPLFPGRTEEDVAERARELRRWALERYRDELKLGPPQWCYEVTTPTD